MLLDFKYWIEQTEHKYACVLATINMPEIVKWTKEHVDQDDFYTEEADHGLETEPHVTILYGLHRDDIREIKSIIDFIRPFQITLGEINKFENNQNFDVLKIQIHSEKLHAINKKFKSLPYTSKYDYNPHCTLAYLKKGACKNLVGNKEFMGQKVKIGEIVFSSKNREKTKFKL